MSDSMASLRRKIQSANDSQAVVRAIKALASSRIEPYEKSVRALAAYDQTIAHGLAACLRAREAPAAVAAASTAARTRAICAVVFGSDACMVGAFNERVAALALETLTGLPGRHRIWAVGVRVQAYLADAGLVPAKVLNAPRSVRAIAPWVAQVLIESEALGASEACGELRLFSNRRVGGEAFSPVALRVLPLDAMAPRATAEPAVTSSALPAGPGDAAATLRALVREYVFIALFRACAESLASESASRVAAMERADTNLDELLEELNRTFHRLRQAYGREAGPRDRDSDG